jgi:hypothetical protein
MWIVVFHLLLFKAKSLDAFHPFKSPFTVSSHVNFGFLLPLFQLVLCLRIHGPRVNISLRLNGSVEMLTLINALCVESRNLRLEDIRMKKSKATGPPDQGMEMPRGHRYIMANQVVQLYLPIEQYA